jgi:hypothetical protein
LEVPSQTPLPFYYPFSCSPINLFVLLFVDWKEVHVYLLRFIFVPATLYGYSNPSPKRKRLTWKMEGGQSPILRTVGLKKYFGEVRAVDGVPGRRLSINLSQSLGLKESL